MKSGIYIIFICNLLACNAFSQRNLDSIRNIAYTAKEDTIVATAFNHLSYFSYQSNPDSATVWANKALSIGKKRDHARTKANSNMLLALISANQSKHQEAIKYNNEAISYYYKIGDLGRVSGCLSNIGLTYAAMSDFPKAMEYMLKATNIAEKANNKKLIGICYGNLGHIAYQRGGQDDKALEYDKKSLAIREELNDQNGIGILYNNIGLILARKKLFAEAMLYHKKSLEIKKTLGDSYGIIYSLENLGTTLLEQAKHKHDASTLPEAKKYYEESLKLAEEIDEPQGISECYKYLGEIDAEAGNYKSAIEKVKKSIDISTSIQYNQQTTENYRFLSELYYKSKDYKNAYEINNKLLVLKDSILNEENSKQVLEMESKYNNEKSQWEIQKLQDDKKFSEEIRATQRKINAYLIVAVVLVALIGVAIFIGFINKRKANRIIREQKEEVDKKNSEIQQQKKMVEYQRDLVEDKNKEILDSINYARKIQYALLANDELLNENLKDHFVLFKPKDIVSGDFYWAARKGEKFYIAVCDSTGHGVPGAFMSLLNISFLNEALNEKNITAPNEVFNHVRRRLIESISQENQRDGMDGVLVCIEKQRITYAAANNKPLLASSMKMAELSYDKMPIGKGESQESYELFSVNAKPGDILYLFTDGYADQFGGPKGKKYKYKALHQLLSVNSGLEIEQQKQELNKAFERWKGTLEQVDDVCVIGIKL